LLCLLHIIKLIIDSLIAIELTSLLVEGYIRLAIVGIVLLHLGVLGHQELVLLDSGELLF
jgi:hypothetical protein